MVQVRYKIKRLHLEPHKTLIITGKNGSGSRWFKMVLTSYMMTIDGNIKNNIKRKDILNLNRASRESKITRINTGLTAVQDAVQDERNEIMTAKQYLGQSFRLNAKIDANKMELERLRALAESVPSPDLSQDRVQTSGVNDRIGSTVVKIVDLEAVIQGEIDHFVDLQKEIRACLDKITDDTLKVILQKRYLNFQKWEQIAVDLECTFQWVHVLHKRALKIFEEFMPLDCN